MFSLVASGRALTYYLLVRTAGSMDLHVGIVSSGSAAPFSTEPSLGAHVWQITPVPGGPLGSTLR